jgi:protein-tyrosine kinase
VNMPAIANPLRAHDRMIARNFAPRSTAQARGPGGSEVGPDLAAAHEPTSAQAQALQRVRQRLQIDWLAPERNMLALLGLKAGVGCSRVVANLGVEFARDGLRTLLVDTDLRAPRLHQIFGVSNDKGVRDVLCGHATSEDAVQAPLPGLDRLSAGAAAGAEPPVSGTRLKQLIESLGKRYQIVLLDTAPATSTADALVVAGAARSALLVVHRGVTRMADVAALQANLKQADVLLVGAVLNQF